MKSLKHLHDYKAFLNEQMEDPEAAASPPKEEEYKCIFLKKGEVGDYKYPDGSSSKNYTTYKVSQSELNDWLSKNVKGTKDKEIADSVLKIKKDSTMEYIAGLKDGISPDNSEYIESFRKACIGHQIGSQMQSIEVIFSPKDNIPTTDTLDVTFILV